MMHLEQARKDLIALQSKLSAYRHALGLMSYDGATAAPKKTAANRARSMAVLHEELYKLGTGETAVSLLRFLDENKERLDAKEQRMVFLLLKNIREMQAIPMDEYIAFSRFRVEADDVWHSAKAANDFALFEPYLAKMFETKKRFAGYCAPDSDPYDYYLDQYETGLTKEKCDAFFAALRERLVPLLKKTAACPPPSNALIRGHFDTARQQRFAEYLMPLIGLDTGHVGLSTTEHPFTTSLGSHFDTRITTHYYPEDISYSMYSVIHEGGHALYETGSAPELAYTVLDGGTSMSIHESQSRFYENIIGRSLPFIRLIFPKVKELYPAVFEGHSAEEFWKAVNRAEPSLIRTKADEFTYCLHVMIRYELEKQIFAGELAVHDLPAAWNTLYKEYLGVDVPDDSRGVLQDSHWSGGLIGYFPSYALGSAYGAQFLKKMQESVDVWSAVERGDLTPVNDWLREHIWQYGRLYTPEELLQKVLGEAFDPHCFTDYLEEKAAKIYGW